jgi:hypothetical protein
MNQSAIFLDSQSSQDAVSVILTPDQIDIVMESMAHVDWRDDDHRQDAIRVVRKFDQAHTVLMGKPHHQTKSIIKSYNGD